MSRPRAEQQLHAAIGQPAARQTIAARVLASVRGQRRRAPAWIAAMVLLPAAMWAQSAPAPAVEQQIRQLRTELQQTRGELAQTQDQLQQVLTELRALRRDLARGSEAAAPMAGAAPYVSAPDVAGQAKPAVTEPAPAGTPGGLEQNQRILAAQVEEQHQTKVESASKYRVKLSGLILVNAFSNRGAVDIPDLANRASATTDRSGIGATFRQSVLGLQVFGPDWAGARTSGSVSADFFGGLPQVPYGSTAGIVRMREATARFDWQNTSLVIGQQTPFFSPLSPTSYATLAEPPLSWAGNLWVWTPQAVLEHRFSTSDSSWFSASGGILLPLTEALPDSAVAPSPGPGQRSRRPAFASEFAFNSTAFGQPVLLGIGGYTSHLEYNFAHVVDAWAVTTDWRLPLGKRLEFSGEGYRGRAVGGLGGGVWQSVAYDGDPNSVFTRVRPLNSIGGWGQLKYRIGPQWEANAAIGQDNVLAGDLRWAPNLRGEFTRSFARNREAFGNVIYRPRSNLLLSLEYRKLWTYPATGPGKTADQINVGAGVSF